MKYIEGIVLINILIHISFVRLSNFIMRRKNNWIAIAISVIVDVFYVISYLLIPHKIESFKYIFILTISIIPFVSKSVSKTLFNTIIYLMFNFILGGFSEIMVNIVNHYWIVLVCLISINILFVLYTIYKKIGVKDYKKMYEIIVEYEEKKYHFDGFYDTGNMLVTEDNIPVVFINNKYIMGEITKKIMVKTVNGSKKIDLYRVDNFMIKINKKYIKKDVYISYSDISFDALFGEALLGG